jgi:signal transduction histidine kinase
MTGHLDWPVADANPGRAADTRLMPPVLPGLPDRHELTWAQPHVRASAADEQAALRRVAMLVARGVQPEELFQAVAVEASRLLCDQSTALLRYDAAGEATVVAVCGGPATVGMRVPAHGGGVSACVLQSGRPVRMDSYDGMPGSAPLIARRIGLRTGAGAPIVVEGRVWGFLGAMSPDEPLPLGTEDRLAQFAELVAVAIANTEHRAQLTASRARIVATADATRRRIQRDLHDGAQQRLVCTVLTLKVLRAALADAGAPEAALADEALRAAEQATADLRELVRGVLPSALSRGGLPMAIESLSRHVDVPLHVDVGPERLPATVETTAYFVVAEALTNTVKHADATNATVRAHRDDDRLLLEVRDDGVGGADPRRGSGLLGLIDRVGACEGSIAVCSPPGHGTRLVVELPLAPTTPGPPPTERLPHD